MIKQFNVLISLLIGMVLLLTSACNRATNEESSDTGATGDAKVTGILVYDSEFIDDNPAYFPWGDGSVLHVRNAIYYYQGNFSDDRLDGKFILTTNFDGDEKSTNETWYWGKIMHAILVLNQNGDVIWDGEFIGEIDEKGIGHGEGTLTGYGINKGLKAILKWTDNFLDDSSVPVEYQGMISAGN